MKFSNQDLSAIFERFELQDFMKVPLPDLVKKNAFYFNAENEGLLDNFYNNYDEFTKHKKNGKIYWIKNVKRDGKIIRKERFDVDRMEDYVLTNQSRLANKTDADFKIIYAREFAKTKSPDTPEIHKEFKKIIFDELSRLIATHKAKNQYKDQKPDLIYLANSFLDFLNTDNGKENKEPENFTKQKNNFTLKQVALLYIYNGLSITRDNGNNIAKKYGRTSGDKLYQHYNKYVIATDRSSSGSKTKDKRLLADIKKVIPHLPEENKIKPNSEIKILEDILQDEQY